MRPDGGSATVYGYDVVRDAHRVRQLTGLTGQYASVDEGLSGTNNLIMVGRLLGLSRPASRARAAELLERFELADAAGRPAKTYSGGMRRRLDLAASLVGRPRVLYLDEPTTGLDPHSRNEVWAMIRALVADGTTVLLTTQYLEEADHLAHDIAGHRPRRGRRATGTPGRAQGERRTAGTRGDPGEPVRPGRGRRAARAGYRLGAGHRCRVWPGQRPGRGRQVAARDHARDR